MSEANDKIEEAKKDIQAALNNLVDAREHILKVIEGGIQGASDWSNSYMETVEDVDIELAQIRMKIRQIYKRL